MTSIRNRMKRVKTRKGKITTKGRNEENEENNDTAQDNEYEHTYIFTYKKNSDKFNSISKLTRVDN